MPPDHSKFLYTIVKQLDLKSIDWAAVAAQLNITNGHAARMRFSRFKQAMEGVAPAPRRRTTSGSARPRKVVKTEKGAAGKKRGSDAIKAENAENVAEPAGLLRVKDEPPDMTTMSLSPTLDQGGGMGDLSAATSDLAPPPPPPACMSPPVAPMTTTPTLTTPGPSRREFGPFAGAYPPPGVVLAPHDPSPSGLVKQEPRWDA